MLLVILLYINFFYPFSFSLCIFFWLHLLFFFFILSTESFKQRLAYLYTLICVIFNILVDFIQPLLTKKSWYLTVGSASNCLSWKYDTNFGNFLSYLYDEKHFRKFYFFRSAYLKYFFFIFSKCFGYVHQKSLLFKVSLSKCWI